MTDAVTGATQSMFPVELGRGKVRYAQAVKAGRWVFVTGCMAQDFIEGIAPDVLAEHAPHAGLPKREKETALIFDHLDQILRAGLSECPSSIAGKPATPFDVGRREQVRLTGCRHQSTGRRSHP